MTDLRKVFDDLVRFETVLWASLDERLQADCEVTLANLNLLLVIDARPACRVQDIAKALAITVGGASQAVDRLEAAGRCVRQANPNDRRSSILTLTDDGQATLRRAAPVFDEELERLLTAPLSATSLGHLAVALDKLRQSAVPAVDGR